MAQVRGLSHSMDNRPGLLRRQEDSTPEQKQLCCSSVSFDWEPSISHPFGPARSSGLTVLSSAARNLIPRFQFATLPWSAAANGYGE